MKLTKSSLRDLMISDAIRKHYELKIIDRLAMFYEFERACDWYGEVLE